tara:strand:+ start:25583 stop:26047 length:465 start_codon:yes stop_codon:yes gene_type:complete
MIIESVAAASAILSGISTMISKANEAGQGAQQLMGTLAEFGEALDIFEREKKETMFAPLSTAELLKLQMIQRSQEKYWQQVHDMMVIADPKLLANFENAKREQKQRHKQHLKALAQQKKNRAKLLKQVVTVVAVALTGIIVSGILISLLILMFK